MFSDEDTDHISGSDTTVEIGVRVTPWNRWTPAWLSQKHKASVSVQPRNFGFLILKMWIESKYPRHETTKFVGICQNCLCLEKICEIGLFLERVDAVVRSFIPNTVQGTNELVKYRSIPNTINFRIHPFTVYNHVRQNWHLF